MRRVFVALFVAGALGACGRAEEKKPDAAPPPAAAPGGVFAAIEAEILVPRCAAQPGCHQGGAPAGGLDLEAGRAHANLVGVKAGRRPDRLRVAPGDPAASYLVERLTPGHDTPLMPVGADPLPAAELERIRAWIQEGARP